MTYNVLVEAESQIVSVEADSEADAVAIALDAALQNLNVYGQVIPLAD